MMGALLARAELLLPYVVWFWLAALTLWNLQLSRALGRQNAVGIRSNGSSPHEQTNADEEGSGPLGTDDSANGDNPLGETVAHAAQVDRDSRDDGPPRDGQSLEKEGRLMLAFNNLASSSTRAEIEAFEAEWAPVAVDEADEGRLIPVEPGSLWFIPIHAQTGWGLILPGADIIGNWAKFYRNLRGAGAPPALAAAYVLVEGPALLVRDPARGRREPDGIAIRSRGELAGI
jgi:hypothetical protein